MKKTIDDWLFWAFQEQLPLLPPLPSPEGFREGWSKTGEWRVGGTNRYGVVHALDQRCPCNPFAIALAEHVLTLSDAPIALPEGWNPCGDFPDLGPEGAVLPARVLASATHIDAQGERRMKTDVADLVRRYALTGQAPDWEVEPPRRDVVRNWNGEPRWFVRHMVQVGADAFGQPIMAEREMEGWSATRRRPVHGAYNKTILQPDPVSALVGRADYEILHAALAVLVEEWPDLCAVAGVTHEVKASHLPCRPWETGAVVPPRVLAAILN